MAPAYTLKVLYCCYCRINILPIYLPAKIQKQVQKMGITEFFFQVKPEKQAKKQKTCSHPRKLIALL